MKVPDGAVHGKLIFEHVWVMAIELINCLRACYILHTLMITLNSMAVVHSQICFVRIRHFKWMETGVELLV